MFFLFVDISKINKFTKEKTDKHKKVIIKSSYKKMYGVKKIEKLFMIERKKKKSIIIKKYLQ